MRHPRPRLSPNIPPSGRKIVHHPQRAQEDHIFALATRRGPFAPAHRRLPRLHRPFPRALRSRGLGGLRIRKFHHHWQPELGSLIGPSAAIRRPSTIRIFLYKFECDAHGQKRISPLRGSVIGNDDRPVICVERDALGGVLQMRQCKGAAVCLALGVVIVGASPFHGARRRCLFSSHVALALSHIAAVQLLPQPVKRILVCHCFTHDFLHWNS
jgi:hypothetical protein